MPSRMTQTGWSLEIFPIFGSTTGSQYFLFRRKVAGSGGDFTPATVGLSLGLSIFQNLPRHAWAASSSWWWKHLSWAKVGPDNGKSRPFYLFFAWFSPKKRCHVWLRVVSRDLGMLWGRPGVIFMALWVVKHGETRPSMGRGVSIGYPATSLLPASAGCWYLSFLFSSDVGIPQLTILSIQIDYTNSIY